jgi:hypothetical protein
VIKWDYFAKEKGYLSAREMLYDLYHGKGMTSTEIGHMLKCHNKTVCEQMHKLGIPLRERKGKNNRNR